jgi:hypothetical protein
MHQIDPTAAQRIDRREDRPLYVGLLRDAGMTPPASDTVWPLMRGEQSPRAACTANACQSGRAQCPCPDACRVPEGSRMAAVWRLLDRIEPGQFWIGYAAFVALAIGGLCLAFR